MRDSESYILRNNANALTYYFTFMKIIIMDNKIVKQRLNDVIEWRRKERPSNFYFDVNDFVNIVWYLFAEEKDCSEYKYYQWKVYRDIYECESKKDWKQSWKRLWAYEILREKVKDQQLWTAYIYGKKEDWTVDIIYKDVSHVQDYYCYKVLDTIADIKFLDPNDKEKWN